MPLSDEDVSEILRIVDEQPLAELRIETEGFSLYVRRGGGGDPTPAPALEPVAALRPSDDLSVIASPMLGTFYRAESPGAKPFIEIGSSVEPDTTVCIIEVMKMMNSVPAGVSGTIVEICATNAQLVEYGQPLFRVEVAP